jgi:hypothetical protein
LYRRAGLFDNPRLVICQEVVDGIAAAIKDGFPAKYALLVRPVGNGFQIIAGHHRKLAAEKAGLKEVPCWVEEMDDEHAFLELVKSNNQSELTNLERGTHFRRSGMSLRAYSSKLTLSHHQIAHDAAAAEFFEAVSTQVDNATREALLKNNRNAHMYEATTAARWLWPAMARRMVGANWNVETTRTNAGRLKDVVQPPIWADRDALAEGVMKPGDVAAMIGMGRRG